MAFGPCQSLYALSHTTTYHPPIAAMNASRSVSRGARRGPVGIVV